jgi:hypothetical protein
MAIVLNKRQKQAVEMIQKFIKTPTVLYQDAAISPVDGLLLKGPAGSGKTSVITNVFHRSQLKIAFCAFTNKATQVLKNISDKFQVEFNAVFMTIHKLLNLNIIYDRSGNLKFIFNAETCDITKYDIIICDECSTISTELFGFIQTADMTAKARGHAAKFIFIGDEWQLPPVNEQVSVIFTRDWPTAELQAVMRSDNDVILSINTRMIQTAVNQEFLDQFPHNIIPASCFLSADTFMSKYLKYIEQDRDVMCITYTVKNCELINNQIQQMRNSYHKRPDLTGKFYINDRCCLAAPFEPVDIVEKDGVYSYAINQAATTLCSTLCTAPYSPSQSPTSQSPSPCSPSLCSPTMQDKNCLYNGITYEIVEVRDVKFRTFLNTLPYMPSTFNAQLLTLKKPVIQAHIGQPRTLGNQMAQSQRQSYIVVHLNPDEVDKCMEICKKKHKGFSRLRENFYSQYPQISYGYCITLYKSQGSEWETVFINLLSIIYSCKKAKQLYRAAYSAISRASKRLYVKY